MAILLNLVKSLKLMYLCSVALIRTNVFSVIVTDWVRLSVILATGCFRDALVAERFFLGGILGTLGVNMKLL